MRRGDSSGPIEVKWALRKREPSMAAAAAETDWGTWGVRYLATPLHPHSTALCTSQPTKHTEIGQKSVPNSPIVTKSSPSVHDQPRRATCPSNTPEA